MRYWLYKCNARDGGPSGYSGDWLADVFPWKRASEWGGHYSTRSAEVAHRLNDDVAPGDVVVAYQTDLKAVVGFCRISKITGPHGDRRLFLKPLHVVKPPFKIHDHKSGTPLASSHAVNGMVMLRELERAEAELIAKLSGTPKAVLQAPPKTPLKPIKTTLPPKRR